MSGLVGPPSGALKRRLARGEIRTSGLHALVLAGFCTVGFVTAVSVRAPRTDLAVRYYAAVLAALALGVVVRAIAVSARSHAGPTFEELTQQGAADAAGTPANLVSLELAVRLGAGSAGDYHVRLRPVLTELARQRLASHGVRLDAPRHRERAEALLGAGVYALVRPDVEPPSERFAPGPQRDAVEQVTRVLEDLA